MFNSKIKKIVLWGHKIHTHTHSYIHGAFYKAFKFLGYETFWLDDNDNIDNMIFADVLFITEGQVDKKIPLNKDCYYLLHNCDSNKYCEIPKKNKLILQVFTYDAPNKYNAIPVENNKYCYYSNSMLYMPWASDLLPDEINQNIAMVENNQFKTKNIINFVGMVIEPWNLVRTFCENNNLEFKQSGGFSKTNVDFTENMKLIQESIVAPAVQCKWQLENGYIPCRIFKNISYGKMGITNNIEVYKLFDEKILYDSDITNLLIKGLKFENENDEYKKNKIIPMMEYVRDNHTYLNRIKIIFWAFDNIL